MSHSLGFSRGNATHMAVPEVGPNRSAERRAQLLTAAAHAIRTHGDDVSMAVIAHEAGITKPILYRHFGDKGGLFRALAGQQTDELLGEIRTALLSPGTVRQRTAATIDAYLSAIERWPAVYRFVVGRAASEEPAVAGQVATLQQRLANELADVLRADLRLAPMRAATWAHAIVGMVRAAGDWWLDTGAVSRPRLVRELTDLVFTGLAAGLNVGNNQRRA